jgi:hypothetical protein
MHQPHIKIKKSMVYRHDWSVELLQTTFHCVKHAAQTITKELDHRLPHHYNNTVKIENETALQDVPENYREPQQLPRSRLNFLISVLVNEATEC